MVAKTTDRKTCLLCCQRLLISRKSCSCSSGWMIWYGITETSLPLCLRDFSVLPQTLTWCDRRSEGSGKLGVSCQVSVVFTGGFTVQWWEKWALATICPWSAAPIKVPSTSMVIPKEGSTNVHWGWELNSSTVCKLAHLSHWREISSNHFLLQGTSRKSNTKNSRTGRSVILFQGKKVLSSIFWSAFRSLHGKASFI